jgi:hypothetical protein
MNCVTFVVSQVTPQVQKEIEKDLKGEVRQLCVSPRLFLVQIPQQWTANPAASETLSNDLVEWERSEESIEIGTQDGQGYLRIHETGWMCEYRQHSTDITQTALLSLHEPLREKKRNRRADGELDANQQGVSQSFHWPVERRPDDEELARRFNRMIAEAIKEEELSTYDRYIWSIACDPATFPGNEERRRALQAWITMGSYSSSAAREAIEAIQQELDALAEEEAIEWIGDIVDEITGDAETLIFSLPVDELEFVARFEVEHQLLALREGMLTEKELYSAFSSFGEYKLLDARPEVEGCLTHPTAAIRRRALETLVIGLELSEYTEIAFRFLHDPDADCRRQGMRCLNPSGKVIEDLRVLKAYAHIAADREETQGVRRCAYSELLAAVGYRLDHDNWEDIDSFLTDGGSLEQAPWIDWQLVQFFLEEASEDCTFHTALAFHTDGDWTEWVDQHGHICNRPEDVGRDILLPAHRIIRTRLSDYQMTISVVPRPLPALRTREDGSDSATSVPS